MERYKSRTIDELGRIVIPSELRKALCIKNGDSISLTVVSTVIVLQKAACDAQPTDNLCQVDDIGMVTLPTQIRQRLDWHTTDKLPLYHMDDLLFLGSAPKDSAPTALRF